MVLNATFQSNDNLTATLGSTVYVPVLEEYTGPFVVTPNTETQTLLTQGLHMAQNVTVNPIPSNYGLITWNGSILTVS